MNIQGLFPLGLTGWISLLSKGFSRVFSSTTVQKHQFFSAQLSLWSNSHIHTRLLEKTIALTRRIFIGKVMSLLFNMLSWLVIADHLTCLLRNLYAGQEAAVSTGHGTTDWFQIGKGAYQGCILSPCLLNSCAEYIMRNARLEEAQAGIKIAGRNINNLRYADDTVLMVESKEELNSLLMKAREESEKVGLKLNIQKTKIMASGPTASWQINEETMETVRDFILWGSKIRW